MAEIARRLAPRFRKAVRPYAMAVGELVWASNHCLNIWNLLYRELFDVDHINIAVRTWHSGRSDGAQLAMVEAAVLGKRFLSLQLRLEILWALGEARRLAANRNDAVHSATRFVIRPNRPVKIITSSISTSPARAEKLSAVKSLIRTFGVARDDFVQLAGYVDQLWEAVKVYPGTYLLPKRPQLRSLAAREAKKR